jgi:hypothetical protein
MTRDVLKGDRTGQRANPGVRARLRVRGQAADVVGLPWVGSTLRRRERDCYLCRREALDRGAGAIASISRSGTAGHRPPRLQALRQDHLVCRLRDGDRPRSPLGIKTRRRRMDLDFMNDGVDFMNDSVAAHADIALRCRVEPTHGLSVRPSFRERDQMAH